MTSNLKINLSITSPNEMLSDKNETLIIGIQENGNSQSSKNIFNKASKGLMNTLIKRKEFLTLSSQKRDVIKPQMAS